MPTGKLWFSFLVIASKKGEYAEVGVYGLAVRVTAPFLFTEAVSDRGSEQFASLRTPAIISGRVAVITKESMGRAGERQGA